MANHNGYTQVEKDFWGEEYLQHYDNRQNKIGTSKIEKDFFGDEFIQHYDNRENKIGKSEYQKDFWGDEYLQHFNIFGEKTGSSEETTDFWGDKKTIHKDNSGEKIGESTEEKDFWGDSYTKNKGESSGSIFSNSLKTGQNVSRMIAGNGSDGDDAAAIVTLVFYMLVIGAIIGIIILLLYIAAMIISLALLISPIVLSIIYFVKKPQEIKWLYWAMGLSFLLCLDLYGFEFSHQLFDDEWLLIFKFVYTSIIAGAGYILLEPWLAQHYPYNEEGEFFYQEKNRRISLASGLGLVSLLLIMASSSDAFASVLGITLGSLFLLAPFTFGGLYLYQKPRDIRWLYFAGGITFLLCLDFYFFDLNRGMLSQTWSLIFQFVYSAGLALIGYILLEPKLAEHYPYNEEGNFLEQQKTRNISLGSTLGVLLLALFLGSNWSVLFSSTPATENLTNNQVENITNQETQTSQPTENQPSPNPVIQNQTSTATTTSTQAWASVDQLRVRKSPAIDGQILDGVPESEMVYDLGEKTDFTITITLRGKNTTAPWHKIRTQRNITGWVFGGGLTFTQPSAKASNPKAVINDPDGFTNVRSKPGTQGKIIEQIKDGKVFEVISQDGDWWEIKTPTGKVGFMHRSRVHLVGG